MFLLDDLLFSLPAKGLFKLFQEISALVEEDDSDLARIQERLLELHTRYALDLLSDDDYTSQEAALLQLLQHAHDSLP